MTRSCKYWKKKQAKASAKAKCGGSSPSATLRVRMTSVKVDEERKGHKQEQPQVLLLRCSQKCREHPFDYAQGRMIKVLSLEKEQTAKNEIRGSLHFVAR